MKETIIYAAIFLLTFIGVWFFRRWSRRRQLLDVPNERSSHTVPTPRGGGSVIVVVCLAAYTVSEIFSGGNFRWSYLLGAAAVALISWLDDIYTISSVWRFVVHSATALLVIVSLGSFDEIYVPFAQNIKIGFAGTMLTFLWIVWLTNAYNFMDGIDGIAGLQAVTAGLGWLLCGAAAGGSSAGFYGGIIAASSFGFLIQNWQPAKIFMGDVGSAFLGYSFAVLPLLAKSENGMDASVLPLLPALAVGLVWLFVFDTLWTFAGRLLKGEKIWQAHRSHLYQKMVIGGFSHRSVSGFYGVLALLNAGILAALLMSPAIRERGAEILILLLGLESAGLIFGGTLAARLTTFKRKTF